MFYKIDDNKNECIITQKRNERLPVAWSNVLTNKSFGCVITDSFGGFTFYKNSKTNKITSFSNDAYEDRSSEKIEFENNNKTWSIDVKNNPDDNEYVTRFGLGYAIFEHESENFEESLTAFVPIDDNVKVQILKLTNKTNKKQQITINYFVDFQMGENERPDRIYEKYNKELNMIEVKNLKNSGYIAFITSNYKIDENKKIHLEFEPEEKKTVIILLGVHENEIKALGLALTYIQKNENTALDKFSKYSSRNIEKYDKPKLENKNDKGMHQNLAKYEKKLEETKQYWKNLTKKITTKTDDKSFDIMQNGPLAYQTIASRLYARCGFYQVSGAYGFRDQLQDAICMKWVDADILKNQIILCSNHQFVEGDVLHWWHDDTSLGIRTRYSDDMLFLVFAVLEYIEFTGDYEILDIKANYIIDEELKENENDRVKIYLPSDFQGTILEHIIKAINRACKFGENGIPLMKSGDWNDGMNKIGQHEKGESIWLGFFLYENIDRFLKVIDENKAFFEGKIDSELLEKYSKINQNLRLKLNTVGWDGKWFIRAIDDNGKIIGSMKNAECKIDSIAQSFSVISGAGDNDKQYIAMKSAEEMLIDEKHHVVKLLTPGFENENVRLYSLLCKRNERKRGAIHSRILLACDCRVHTWKK